MPRTVRVASGGMVYHVIKRGGNQETKGVGSLCLRLGRNEIWGQRSGDGIHNYSPEDTRTKIIVYAVPGTPCGTPSKFWSVSEGAVTGRTTGETKLRENNFLIWKEEVEDFALDRYNDYTIIAQGGRVVLKINGHSMCELDDRDPRRLVRGALALQVHVGPPMQVWFKDIFLRKL